eukprot:357633-Chlamydomonas_euryale.AAC.11
MQHKGKLPRYETEASKRHDAIYHKTTKRIFPPGADGVGPFVESMLESAAKNIAAAAPHVGPTDRTQAYTLPASEAGTTATSCAVRAEKHQFLKVCAYVSVAAPQCCSESDGGSGPGHVLLLRLFSASLPC